MKNILKVILKFAAIIIFIAVSLNLNGCTKVNSPSLYNPNLGNGPQPVVDSLSPSGSALAGIDTLTIYGKNFSADRDSDGVDFLANGKLVAYYDSRPGDIPIISASPTKLVVTAPPVGDSVKVMVWTMASTDFSQPYGYVLQAAVSAFSKFASGEEAAGLAVGPDDSLYASIYNLNNTGTKDEGIFEIGPTTGIRSTSPYVLSSASNLNWSAIKFGSGGYVYAVKGNRAVYQLTPGQTNPGGTIWLSSFTPAATSFNDLDFDSNHNLWVAGNNKNIYSINVSDKSTKAFPFAGNVRALRYYNGNLYIAANVTGTTASQVFSAPIVNDSLGTPQLYFDLSTDPTGGANIYAMTFSADGDMYAGTDSSDYLIVVHPGGTFEKPFSLYVTSKVLASPPKAFAWIGSDLFAATGSGTLLKIVARKQGAPYYGIQ